MPCRFISHQKPPCGRGAPSTNVNATASRPAVLHVRVVAPGRGRRTLVARRFGKVFSEP